MKKLIEVALVTGAFTESIWLGIFALGYIIYIKDEHKKMKNQLDACLTEVEVEEPKSPKIKGTSVMKINLYKECVIEEHQILAFRITKPGGEILDKIFYTLKDAKEEIDTIYPYLQTSERKRRKSRI